MARIQCCGGLRRASSFVVDPIGDFVFVRLYILESCPVCNHKVAVVHRLDSKNHYSQLRKSNIKALKLIERLKSHIVCKDEFNPFAPVNNNYLRYNSYGSVQKCYSGLSTVKVGLFDPYEGLDVVDKSRFIRVED